MFFSVTVHDISTSRYMSNKDWLEQFIQLSKLVEMEDKTYPLDDYKLTISLRQKGDIYN